MNNTDKTTSLITVLQREQEENGYISADAVYRISNELGVSPAKIYGVASFYTQFTFSPSGKYTVMLCRGTACHVNGADSLLSSLEKLLGIADGQTTEDGLFSIKTVACLGCCSISPVIMINGTAYGKLTADSLEKIISEIRKNEEETK